MEHASARDVGILSTVTISSAQPIVRVNNLAAIWQTAMAGLSYWWQPCSLIVRYTQTKQYVGLLYRRPERKNGCPEPHTTSMLTMQTTSRGEHIPALMCFGMTRWIVHGHRVPGNAILHNFVACVDQGLTGPVLTGPEVSLG